MFPVWVSYPPVNLSQGLSAICRVFVVPAWPHCFLPSQVEPSSLPTHLLGLWSAISLEKSHMRPREEARTFSLANLWSHFCCIIVCNAGTAQVTIPFRHCKWSWVESFPSSPTGSAGRRWSPPWFSVSLLQPVLLQDVKRYQLLTMILSALCHKWHCFPAIKPGQSEIVMPDRSL